MRVACGYVHHPTSSDCTDLPPKCLGWLSTGVTAEVCGRSTERLNVDFSTPDERMLGRAWDRTLAAGCISH